MVARNTHDYRVCLEKEMARQQVSLPGKSHGQRNLTGYSPWGHKRVRHDLATKQTTGFVTVLDLFSRQRHENLKRKLKKRKPFLL